MFWLKQFAQALAWKATLMRHKSPGQFDGIALNRHPRSWQDEPPIKNPERLRYLLTLLQQELSVTKRGGSQGAKRDRTNP
jgi:hypothetical protein